MGNTAFEQEDTLTNGNGTKTRSGLIVHELGIKNSELIPRNCRNCHCLQTGMKPGTLVLIGETQEKQQWIICVQSEKGMMLPATVHLEVNGISEDRGETATKAELIEKKGHYYLFNLLNEMKGSNLEIHEVMNKQRHLAAFHLKPK